MLNCKATNMCTGRLTLVWIGVLHCLSVVLLNVSCFLTRRHQTLSLVLQVSKADVGAARHSSPTQRLSTVKRIVRSRLPRRPARPGHDHVGQLGRSWP